MQNLYTQFPVNADPHAGIAQSSIVILILIFAVFFTTIEIIGMFKNNGED